MSGESFDVTLDLSTHGLGLSIVGGTDAPARPDDGAIYISRVDQTGAGFVAGLRIGDRITQVGAVQLTDVKHDEAIAIIKEELGSLVRVTRAPPACPR